MHRFAIIGETSHNHYAYVDAESYAAALEKYAEYRGLPLENLEMQVREHLVAKR